MFLKKQRSQNHRKFYKRNVALKIKLDESVRIYKNVEVGGGSTIEQGVIIGIPPFGREDGELNTTIGENAYIRAYTIIYAGTVIGNNFQTGPNVLIREDNEIGDNVVVWHGSTLNPGNRIGDETRVHASCFLEDVTLGKRVFLGPRVTFTDDPHPMVPINFRECWKGATVGESAVLGGNVTVLPHIKIGEHSVVGAGCVVVKDIPPYKVVVGNPGRIIKDVKDVVCKRSGKTHRPYQKIG